ncbi:MAG: lipocalin-like domain-containing protein, partial [Wenzhouxiangella sp.]
LATIMLLVTALVAWLGWQTRETVTERVSISLEAVLGEAPDLFRRVTGPEPLEFPADHGSHPDYRSEWWYFTGNLEDDERQRMGFQFTLFRYGLEPGPALDSEWQTDHLWMGHMALSDGRQQRFFQAERFSRDALGLAGATPDRWWIRDWRIERQDDGWILRAETDEFGLDLELRPIRGLVLQGDHGYSRKGPEPGNASRYYSATRLQTSGRVRLADQWLEVSGLSWLDREWGSGQLSDTIVGWDWFALHLDDGRDVMIYRLREPDGSASKYSAGTLVAADGSARTLVAEDFHSRITRWWRDPTDQQWPLEWHIDVFAADLRLAIRPIFDHQLWKQSVRYWEGAVDVLDADTGQTVGRGYMELSGYAEPPPPR